MSADDRSISELLASLCDETISAEEMERLDRLICTDPAVRQQYIEYLDLHARLSYQFREPAEAILSLPTGSDDGEVPREWISDNDLPVIGDDSQAVAPSPPIVIQPFAGFIVAVWDSAGRFFVLLRRGGGDRDDRHIDRLGIPGVDSAIGPSGSRQCRFPARATWPSSRE